MNNNKTNRLSWRDDIRVSPAHISGGELHQINLASQAIAGLTRILKNNAAEKSMAEDGADGLPLDEFTEGCLFAGLELIGHTLACLHDRLANHPAEKPALNIPLNQSSRRRHALQD